MKALQQLSNYTLNKIPELIQQVSEINNTAVVTEDAFTPTTDTLRDCDTVGGITPDKFARADKQNGVILALLKDNWVEVDDHFEYNIQMVGVQRSDALEVNLYDDGIVTDEMETAYESIDVEIEDGNVKVTSPTQPSVNFSIILYGHLEIEEITVGNFGELIEKCNALDADVRTFNSIVSNIEDKSLQIDKQFNIIMDNLTSQYKNKWFFEMYSKLSARPTLDEFNGKNPTSTRYYLDTEISTRLNLGENYSAKGTTYLYCDNAVTTNLTFKTDDGGRVYLNGVEITNQSTNTAPEITCNFNKGWNELIVTYTEDGGDDGFSVSPNLYNNPNFSRMLAIRIY